MTQKTYDKQTGKLIARIAENMPQMDSGLMQEWIDNPRTLQGALKEIFCPPEVTSNLIKVWKTIKLGTKSVEQLRKELSRDCLVTGCVNDLMDQKAFTVAKTETEVNLAVLSVKELGEATGQDFSQGAGQGAIYGAIRQIGDFCPAEVGPQLRLQYMDQLEGGIIVVAMKPIPDSDGRPCVFVIRHGGSGRLLRTGDGDADVFLSPARQLVFVPRK